MSDTEAKEFEKHYIFVEYENGKPVCQIANEIGKSEPFVYAYLRSKPEKYEDIKRIREERLGRTLRRVRGLADNIALRYLESLQAKLDDPELEEEEKMAVFKQIEQVARIAKLYSDRVNLAEGKATENIGLSNAGLPFKMIVTKNYATKEEADNAPDD